MSLVSLQKVAGHFSTSDCNEQDDGRNISFLLGMDRRMDGWTHGHRHTLGKLRKTKQWENFAFEIAGQIHSASTTRDWDQMAGLGRLRISALDQECSSLVPQEHDGVA